MEELKLIYEPKLSELKKVRMVIDSAYKWGRGWTEEEATQFESEIYPKLEKAGFKITYSDSSMTCPSIYKNDGTSLYLHPMEFTGYLTEDDIEKIVMVLADCKSAKLVDLNIEIVEHLSDEEYVNILQDNSDRIIAWLKSNSYNDGFEFAEHYRIKRDVDSSGYCSTDADIQYVNNLKKLYV